MYIMSGYRSEELMTLEEKILQTDQYYSGDFTTQDENGKMCIRDRGSIADRVQGISPFWYRFGAVFNAHVCAFSLCLSRLAGFEKDCFSRYAAP